MEPDSKYTPKVNEHRQVVGTLQGVDNDLDYVLRPPTNRDLIAIEKLYNDHTSEVEAALQIFALLSGIAIDTLLDLSAESMEGVGKALECFRVFRDRSKR